MIKYRLHITCPAKHKTYQDYTTKQNAQRAWKNIYNDLEGWFAVRIEKVILL